MVICMIKKIINGLFLRNKFSRLGRVKVAFPLRST